MKEPWEIFLDEFKREARRRGKLKNGLAQVTEEEFHAAFESAWEATAFHLVDELHWRDGDTSVLLRQFIESLSSGPSPEVALRRTWEEWSCPGLVDTS